ncbi:hypothetical protein DFP72DRAFT_632074 [Ephemerocybe angulata]|uniref:Uncharacterized protein n=1 Tax=Ephemerocybe angulata TaxID=980116 RepID=A0A8H6IC90_9AGAR|nr:hypothetical protein DFP72DRAFT_632074 [Tulosesus angulatus]
MLGRLFRHTGPELNALLKGAKRSLVAYAFSTRTIRFFLHTFLREPSLRSNMATSRQITFTIPTMLGLQTSLDRFDKYLVTVHPKVTFWTCLLLIYKPKLPFQLAKIVLFIPFSILKAVLRCFGFGPGGIGKDSYAARYQRDHYGGYTPGGGSFASYQSYGATGYNDKEKDSGWFWFFMRIAYIGMILHLASEFPEQPPI